jgi:indolepyruvate decarboxylase
MPKTKLADYLFERIKSADVEYSFGIPGDFVLPHYAAQLRVGLKTVVMTHEPSVGYAASAYACARGLGVALVTYGAGGLNMVNPTAMAYAEEIPLLVISGSPETKFHTQKAQLHHCVKTFDTQYLTYQQVTDTYAWLTDPNTAQKEIDRVIDTVRDKSTPGYIEMPRDLVNCEFEPTMSAPSAMSSSASTLKLAVNEIVERLRSAKHPVLFVGAQIARFKLGATVVALSEALGLPAVTSSLGKGSFPESHPNFIGSYFGCFGNPAVREYVEASDCTLCLGAVLTEMETGGYTAKLDPDVLIHATTSELTIGHHSYQGVELHALIAELLQDSSKLNIHFEIPKITPESSPVQGGQVTVAGMLDDIGAILNSNKHSVVCDVGDCLYAGLNLKTDHFFAPGYYSTMGYGVPAAIGAALALPDKRPIVLVGDGGFQMTGMELGTAARLGIQPIVIVFNNSSYGMLQFMDQLRSYYDLSCWDYVGIAKALGCDGARAKTQSEFKKALSEAQKSELPFIIDAVIAKDDISATLRRLTDHFGAKVRAAIAG